VINRPQSFTEAVNELDASVAQAIADADAWIVNELELDGDERDAAMRKVRYQLAFVRALRSTAIGSTAAAGRAGRVLA
jgi:hypothetical protein